jgi:hypothetical protein
VKSTNTLLLCFVLTLGVSCSKFIDKGIDPDIDDIAVVPPDRDVVVIEPPADQIEPTRRPPAPLAISPEQVISNLERAFQDRDQDLYESLLDVDFWFTETDCNGDLVFANGLEEELNIMGSRDGSSRGIFDIFRTVEFDFTLQQREIEFGPEFPESFAGDPDGHADEDWQVFRGRVQILLLETNNDGFRVDQAMTYKLRRLTPEELAVVAELSRQERDRLLQNGESIWRMIRWDNDALAGGNDCSNIAGKANAAAAESTSWGEIKASLYR